MTNRAWLSRLARDDVPAYMNALCSADPENAEWYAMHGIMVHDWKTQFALARFWIGGGGDMLLFDKRAPKFS